MTILSDDTRLIHTRTGQLLFRSYFLGILCFALLFLDSVAVFAHSTKGRIKVPLDKPYITVDDVAYFAESYVYRHLFDDGTRRTRHRFFLREFIGIETGVSTIDVRRKAVDIHFVVLDKKDNRVFNDYITIDQDKNGIWHYHPPGGKPPVELFTYIPETTYFLQKYATVISAGGILCGGFVLIIIRRLKKGRSVPDAPDKTAQNEPGPSA
jgi:hypothetical protein